MQEIISAFLLVFLAEMGDKTQFLALIFATKYKIRQVILGVFLGILVNHGLAVIIAYFLASFIRIEILKIIAGIMFLLFGFESFILKLQDDEEGEIKQRYTAIITIAVCFFLGELGDKTQITAMSIVFTGSNPIYTLIGTTSAMMCVSIIGIILGKIIKGKIDKNIMKKISGCFFIFFGIDALIKSIPKQYITKVNIGIFIICMISIFLIISVKNKNVKRSMIDEKY